MTNTLTHHGIQGQKWGERNGPPYPLSKSPSTKSKTKVRKTEAQKESERQKRYDVKNRGALSDEELQAKIKRLQMEKQLRELTESELNYGKRVTDKTIENIGTKVATTAIPGATLYLIKSAVSGEFDAKELGNAIFNGGAKKK